MSNVWAYSLVSVFIVSLISFVGVVAFAFKSAQLKRFLTYMVSFSAGALFGDAFIHLLPEAAESSGFGPKISIYILTGIAFSFLIEKVIHWRHCHIPTSKEHPHPFAVMNLFGDIVHNFVDGLAIGASYLASLPVGIATTIAVVLHEIPQEIGDFGILLHGGFTRGKALFFNFIVALTSFFGVFIALSIGNYVEGITAFMLPFAAGGFIYIAGSDLIPELHKEVKLSISSFQFLAFVLGILVMALLLLVG